LIDPDAAVTGIHSRFPRSDFYASRGDALLGDAANQDTLHALAVGGFNRPVKKASHRHPTLPRPGCIARAGLFL